MAIICDVILRWDATPDQLRDLGTALWRWCTQARGDAGIYQYLDSQVLADLIEGKHPVSAQTPQQAERGLRFGIRDEASHDHQATLRSLRRELPAAGVEDILAGGTSWNLAA
jgi:hypothetical protein